jgi:hypothetical protein
VDVQEVVHGGRVFHPGQPSYRPAPVPLLPGERGGRPPRAHAGSPRAQVGRGAPRPWRGDPRSSPCAWRYQRSAPVPPRCEYRDR